MTDLADAQAATFAALDPQLPPPPALPAGTEVTAGLPDGRTVLGRVYQASYRTGDVESLWEPRTVWEFTPLLGDTGAEGMEALLRALRAWLQHEVPADRADGGTAVRVTWPSRDVAAMPALYRHGFVPMTALAIRTQPNEDPPGSPRGVTVRRATMDDLDELVAIHFEELAFSSPIIDTPVPDNARELLTLALNRAVFFSGKVLLAESRGVAVGAVDCGLASPDAGTTVGDRLAPGRWGYIGTLSVLPTARGTGVGGALVAAAHRMLETDAERGTFLFYEFANPLSSVFWPRHGYRPLWTKWVCKPAGKLLAP